MQTTINQILAPFKARGIDAGSEKVGPYWQIWIGDHAGARKDGVALARELANRALRDRRPAYAAYPEPEIMDIPAFLKSPEPPPVDPRLDLQAARIAELEAMLAAKANPPPSDPPTTMSADVAAPPAELADLFLPNETPPETHERLMKLFMEAKQCEEIARRDGGTNGSFNGKSAMEWLRKAEHYDSGIRWNRGRLAEII